MKKFSKIFIVLIIIALIITMFVFIALNLVQKPEENPGPVDLPKPTEVEDEPFADSLVSRENSNSRADEFNYDLSISIKETMKISDEYSWSTSGAEKIILNDDSSIYLNQYIVSSGYSIENKDDGILIKTNANDYIMEIKKINVAPFEYVTNKDNFNEENEVINQYDRIKEEYNTIYSSDIDKSTLEYGGIGTYTKMIEFIEENNLQKDIGLYTSDQVREVMEKAFNVELDESFVDIDYNKFFETDFTSHRIEKTTQIEGKDDYLYKESYFLISNGTEIYACHLNYELYIPSERDFEEVIVYTTICPQLY